MLACVMATFLSAWSDAALTSLGFFWMAFWAFGLGYFISSVIQVVVSRDRMTRAMGDADARSVALATFFGFVSSSCSFSALATTRSIFAKGAGFIPSLAFLLASTNLVIELGIIIAVFLGWQFIVGEYVGGVLLILVMWGIVRLTDPSRLVARVRDRLEGGETHQGRPVSDLFTEPAVWGDIARTYFGEWRMVWKDVTVGFTIAGVIAVFVPTAFFAFLFPGTGEAGGPGFAEIVSQALIGPVAAFFTFIGSMGNIPLAGVLYGHGVSMAGIMAFIFSDLIVFPVLRVNARFYGWKMALYIAGVFLAALVLVSLVLHYGFAVFGLLPEAKPDVSRLDPAERFGIDYTFVLNLVFALVTAAFGWLAIRMRGSGGHHHDHGGSGPLDRILTVLAVLSYGWLFIGLVLGAVLPAPT